MATIDLKIVADSAQAVQEINKITNATQSMQRTVQEGEKRQKGLIEDTISALKKFEDARNKAMTTEGIEKYNKKIAEAKQTLKEYETIGVNANKNMEKSGNSLLQSLGKWALGFATVTAAVKLFKNIIASTETTAHQFEIVVESTRSGLQYFFKTLASGDWSNFMEGLQNAIDGAKRYVDELEVINNMTNEQNIRSAEYDKQISDLRAETWNREDENNDKRKKALTEIINLQKKKFDEEAALLRKSYENNLQKAASDSGLSEQQIENFIKEYSTLEDMIAIGELYTAKTKAMRNAELGPEYVQQLKDERDALGANAEEAAKYARQVGKITEETRAKLSAGLVTAIQKEAQFNASNRRDKMQLAALEAEEKKKSEDALKKSNDDKLKMQEDFNKAIIKLNDDYQKANIENLTGEEQITALRDFNIQAIDAEKARLEELGTLTAEQLKWIEALRDLAYKQALKDINEFHRQELEAERKANEEMLAEIADAYSDQQALWDLEKDIELQALELAGKDTEDAMLEIEKRYLQRRITAITARIEKETDVQKKLELQKVKELLQGEIATIDKEVADSKFNFWESIGITDPDEQQKAEDNLRTAVDTMVGVMDDIFANRVEDAQRNRDLIDEQIEYTSDALDREMELAKLGYANNVAAKQKELEALKKEREKALKEEEKALKAQRALDTVMQLSSLVTATANIIKSMSGMGVVGTVLSIAAIAAMFSTFAAAKSQAAKATKLAEGGVGTVDGRSHAEGGEPFLNHVEVERGEMWGVLSKPATAKHGREFAQIVTSFNKDNLVMERADAPNNYINVDVNQTNSRLDKVEYQLIKLNRHFGSKKEIHDLGSVRIEKIGNKTRIIRK